MYTPENEQKHLTIQTYNIHRWINKQIFNHSFSKKYNNHGTYI